MDIVFSDVDKDGNVVISEGSIELLLAENNFTKGKPNIEVLQDGKYVNNRGNHVEYRTVRAILPYKNSKTKSIAIDIAVLVGDTEFLKSCKPRTGFKQLEKLNEGKAETFSKLPAKGAKKARQQEKTDKLQEIAV